MENILKVKNVNGEDININVIDIIEDTLINKEYICYHVNGIEGIFVSGLIKKENGYSLESVTEEERQNIEQVLAQDVEE